MPVEVSKDVKGVVDSAWVCFAILLSTNFSSGFLYIFERAYRMLYMAFEEVQQVRAYTVTL